MDALLLATRNPGKLREMEALLRDLPVRVVVPPDLPEIEETGATIEENAILKARAAAQRYGSWALAEDAGLEVDALGGEPGARSRRFAGPGASDAERNALLLRRLAGVPDEQRTARFRAVVAIAAPDGRLWTFEGTCEGRIASAPRGTGGFGFDPIFLLPDRGRTMAELTVEEKNRISHRGKALRQAIGFLRQAIGAGDP